MSSVRKCAVPKRYQQQESGVESEDEISWSVYYVQGSSRIKAAKVTAVRVGSLGSVDRQV